MFPTPPTEHGARVALAFCEECATVRAFADTRHGPFPNSGFWVECPVCGLYRMFYRIRRRRAVHE